MKPIASQITIVLIVCSIVYSGTDQRKHQSCASLVFVRGIHRWPVESSHLMTLSWIFVHFDRNLRTFVLRVPSEISWVRYQVNTKRHQGITWTNHDDVINWKHFPRNWPFVRGIHRSPVNSPPKKQWPGALMFSLICVWTNGWVNNREAGDLGRYRTHFDVIVMIMYRFTDAVMRRQTTTLRPRQNGHHFADDIFKCILLNEKCGVFIKSSLKFVHKGPINNKPALV